MKVFIGIALSADQATKLNQQFVAQLGKRSGGFKAVPIESYHLTLAFLGELDSVGVEALNQTLPRYIEQKPFELHFERFGLLADKWWVAFAESNPLLQNLYNQLWQGLQSLGYSLPKQAFRPHITLASGITRPASLVFQNQSLDLALPVDRVCLFESHSNHAGRRYTPLILWSL